MDILESITRVLAVGLILGAGLPALFALGLRLLAKGGGGQSADGTVTTGNPLYRAAGYFAFGLVIAVVVLGILWITRQTIYFHFDVRIFPDFAYD